MSIPIDHECFNWEFATSRYSDAIKFYLAYNGEGDFGWVNTKDNKFTKWGAGQSTIEQYIENSWIKTRTREGFCGPLQPPVSPLIKKIRLMERRHKTYLEKKYG